MSAPVQTLRKGNTPDERVILTAANTAVPTADPSNTDDKGWNLGGGNWLHVYVELPGTMTELRVTPWYWSSISNQWFEGDQIVFNATNKLALVQTEGEEKVFFVADAVTGTGTFKLWAGYTSVGVLEHF